MSQTTLPNTNAPRLWDWFEKAPNHVVTCRQCKEDVVQREYASTPMGATSLRQELWKHLKWRHHNAYLITVHLPEQQVESTPFPYVTQFTLKLCPQRKRKASSTRTTVSVPKSEPGPAASSQHPRSVKFTFTADQRLKLCETFSKSTYPSVAQRKELAQQFNVREKSVDNWFKRRRSTECKKAGRSTSASSAVAIAENTQECVTHASGETQVAGENGSEQGDANRCVADGLMDETVGPMHLDDSFEEEL